MFREFYCPLMYTIIHCKCGFGISRLDCVMFSSMKLSRVHWLCCLLRCGEAVWYLNGSLSASLCACLAVFCMFQC